MAKSFYNAEEAAARLQCSEEDLKDLVRSGKLREFRDASGVTYKVGDVDKLAPAEDLPALDPGEIMLEPAEPEPSGESGIEFGGGSDVLSLSEVDSDDTAAGAGRGKRAERAKEGSVVSSVGVSVFDDDELDEIVDPLAQTHVSDAGALGIEAVGSGSGILDLTRERDDTSLGAELLDEIYTGEDETVAESNEVPAAGTAVGATGAAMDAGDEREELAPAAGAPRVAVRQVYEYTDAGTSALTAVLAVAVVVMLFAGLGAAALVQGVEPALLQAVYGQLMYYAGGSALAAVLAGVVTFVVARRG